MSQRRPPRKRRSAPMERAILTGAVLLIAIGISVGFLASLSVGFFLIVGGIVISRVASSRLSARR
jgi:hypothetical protein